MAFDYTFSNTSAITVVAANGSSSVTLLAANANRKAFSFYNDSTAVVYVYAGTSTPASSTNFWLKMDANGGFYESTLPVYKGAFNAIWNSASVSSMMVTDFR